MGNLGQHFSIDLGTDHIHEKQILGRLIGAELCYIEAGHIGKMLLCLIHSRLQDAVIAFAALHPVIELIEIQVHTDVGTLRSESDSRIGFALQLFNLVHANPNAGRGIFQSCTNVLFGPCGEFLEIHHCVSSLKIKLAHPHTADLADT